MCHIFMPIVEFTAGVGFSWKVLPTKCSLRVKEIATNVNKDAGRHNFEKNPIHFVFRPWKMKM